MVRQGELCFAKKIRLIGANDKGPSTQFPSSESDDDKDAFFCSRRRPHVNVQDVVANFFHDSSDTLASLGDCSSLKPTFITLNTPLPQSWLDMDWILHGFDWIGSGFSVENGRYGHAPIPIRLLSALVSQPLVILDQAGRLENAAYTQWWH